jgi:hypothetical protein
VFRTLEQQEIAEGVSYAGQKAYLRSSQNGPASKWIGSSIAAHTEEFFKSEHFAAALRLRLLAPPLDERGRPLEECKGCGTSLEGRFSHPQSCGACNAKGYGTRHVHLREETATMLRNAFASNGDAPWGFGGVVLQRPITVKTELKVRVQPPIGWTQGDPLRPHQLEPRMDIVIQGREEDTMVLIDVAVVDVGCATYLQAGAAGRADAAAEAREKDKRSDFRRTFNGISDDQFVPFVVEATGRLGPSAKSFLDTVVGEQTGQGPLRKHYEEIYSLLCARNAGRMAIYAAGGRPPRQQSTVAAQGLAETAETAVAAQGSAAAQAGVGEARGPERATGDRESRETEAEDGGEGRESSQREEEKAARERESVEAEGVEGRSKGAEGAASEERESRETEGREEVRARVGEGADRERNRAREVEEREDRDTEVEGVGNESGGGGSSSSHNLNPALC